MPRRDLAGPLVFAALLAALPASAQTARVTPVPTAALGGAAAAVGSELALPVQISPLPFYGRADSGVWSLALSESVRQRGVGGEGAAALILPLSAAPKPAVAVRPAAAASIEGTAVRAAGLAARDAVPTAVEAKEASALPAEDGAAADSPAASHASAAPDAKVERLDERAAREPASTRAVPSTLRPVEGAARGLELMPVEEFLSSFFDGASHLESDLELNPGIDIPSFERPSAGIHSRAELTELDGHGGQVELTPGSIFSWRPIEESPNHGFAPLDWFLRKLLGHKGGRFAKGYEFRGAADRDVAQVFFYGERHTDKALIAENLRALAADLRPGKGAIILDEGYFGPVLRGYEAVLYLSKRGMDYELLGPIAEHGVKLEVRGWDRKETYDLSHHPVLQHHMNLYDVNQHLFSERRGLGYYVDLARKLYATWRNWEVMRELAIDRRNAELDASVRAAVEEAGRTGRSVHVIAGAEHLVEHPLLAAVPLIGRPSMRRALIDAVGGAGWWTSKPADSPGLPD